MPARSLLVVVAILLRAVSAADAAYLRYGDATVAAGAAGQIAVLLRTEGDEIAGVQNEIALPPALHLIAAACYANPAIAKDGTTFAMLWHTTGGERLRAVVLSLKDVEPIPDNSVLYTCDLEVAVDAQPGTYRVRALNLLASDSSGRALPLRGVDAVVTVGAVTLPAGASSEAPGSADPRDDTRNPRRPADSPTPNREPPRRAASTPVPTPTATPHGAPIASGFSADLSPRSGAGCHIASDPHQSSLVDLLVLAALGVVRSGHRRRPVRIRLGMQQ